MSASHEDCKAFSLSCCSVSLAGFELSFIHLTLPTQGAVKLFRLTGGSLLYNGFCSTF